HVGEVAHGAAAVLFLDGDAEQAHVAEFAPQVHGEFVAAVDVGGAWCDLRFDKLLYRVAQHVDAVTQVKIHGREIHRNRFLDSRCCRSGPARETCKAWRLAEVEGGVHVLMRSPVGALCQLVGQPGCCSRPQPVCGSRPGGARSRARLANWRTSVSRSAARSPAEPPRLRASAATAKGTAWLVPLT